ADNDAPSLGDAAQRALEHDAAQALRARYCDRAALRVGSVTSFAAGEVKVRLRAKGHRADEVFDLVGADGREKGEVTLTTVDRAGREAKGTFVNTGESLQLPRAGDVLRRRPVALALLPLFSAVSLGRDPLD